MRVAWLMAVLAVPLACSAARAQIQLPGAIGTPTPSGASGAPPAGQAKPRGPDAAVVRAPGDETIQGRQFQRNGKSGLIAFERKTPVEISRLVLLGENLERSYEACRVEISGGKIPVKPVPPAEGLVSFEVEMEACPFAIDVLDGAVRIRGKVCEIKAAACRVDPTGVWGPTGSSIGPEEAKTIERQRGQYEKEARDLYKALINGAGKDRPRQKQLAADQAGFSSRREVACRDYAGEEKHGFCASRITLARAVSLSAELHGTKPAAKPAPKRKPAPKPAAPVLPPPGIQ